MHVHEFDPVSGWCGCGYREDGRLISKRGQVFRPGDAPDPERERLNPTGAVQ